MNDEKVIITIDGEETKATLLSGESIVCADEKDQSRITDILNRIGATTKEKFAELAQKGTITLVNKGDITATQNAKGEIIEVAAKRGLTTRQKKGLLAVGLGVTTAMLSSCGEQPKQKPEQTLVAVQETPTAEPIVEPTVEPTPEVTSTPLPTVAPINVDAELAKAFNENPTIDMNFLQNDARFILSMVNNEDYMRTTIDAISFCRKFNSLTEKEGNFRLPQDGDRRLYAFAQAFYAMSSKIKGYSGQDLSKTYGTHVPTADEYLYYLTDGYALISTYAMTGVEPIPLEELVENQTEREQLYELMNAIFSSNAKTANGTVTDDDHDRVIATKYKMFDNNPNVPMSFEVIGRPLVYGYVAMQSAIDNGKGLTLSKHIDGVPDGYSLLQIETVYNTYTGENEKIPSGNEFMVQTEDNRTYEECIKQGALDQITLNSLQNFYNYVWRDFDTAKDNVARYIEFVEGGHSDYADTVRALKAAEITEAKAFEIKGRYPQIADYVDELMAASKKEASNFDTVCLGIDTISGANGQRDYTYDQGVVDLINIRRDLYKEKTYTPGSYNPGSGQGGKPTTQTETKVEKNPQDLTPEQQQDVENQVQEAQEKEKEKNNNELEKAQTEGTQAVENAGSQEEAEQVGAQYNIDVNPDAYQNIQNAKEEQQQGEEKKEKIEKETEENNAAKEQKSKEDAAAEAIKQDQAAAAEAAAIEAGNNIKLGPDPTAAPVTQAPATPTASPKPTPAPAPATDKPYNPAADSTELPPGAEPVPYTGANAFRTNEATLRNLGFTPKVKKLVRTPNTGKIAG